jgi:hypothetical protein
MPNLKVISLPSLEQAQATPTCPVLKKVNIMNSSRNVLFLLGFTISGYNLLQVSLEM